MTPYITLALAAACPAVASALVYLLDKKTAFGALRSWKKQLIYGMLFGALAVVGTEFGIPIDGAIVNARDAAPLCAGLIFGAPAGVLAGLIGGVERWLCVYWGGGAVTRLACSVSTVLAGLVAAAMRKWMFDDKKPSWVYGLAAGVAMEVFHMLMVFFTNMGNVRLAFGLVKICSGPMIVANSLSVALAMLAVSLLGREHSRAPKGHRQLTQTFSRWLLAVVAVAFICTSVFTFFLQNNLSVRDSEDLLLLNLSDVKADIEDASDANLLALARRVADALNARNVLTDDTLVAVQAQEGSDLSEINVVDAAGVIAYSTNSAYHDFDMASGEQSAAFLPLLDGKTKELVQRYQPISRDNATYMKYAGIALDRGGFVQVGYNARRFRRDIDAQVVGATRNRHVGETGYVLIAADNWILVSDPGGHEGSALTLSGLRLDPRTTPENTRFAARVYGQDCYCMYTLTEGYYIIAVEPAEEVQFSRDLAVCANIFMEVLVFAALYVLVYLLIKKLVVENIHEVNRSLKEITGGNLDVAVDVRTNEEFVSLSDDINSTVLTLKGYIAEAAARIDKELELAKVIQASSLPGVFPPWPERTDFDIFASMDAAREVGGDFYDFYLLEDGRLVFLVADVSGKGITAAMFMMKAKTILKSYAEKERDVARVLTLANNALCEGNDAEMFVTCWMGILDLPSHTLTFASAGHNPPLIRHRDGGFEYLRTKPGLVLAGMEGVRYRSGEVSLRPGDEIFLYTDGVTEATDGENRLYGEERLLQAVNALENASAQRLCQGVKEDVDRFVGDAPQFDDITMLCLRLLPKNAVTLTPDEAGMAKAAAFLEESLDRGGVPPAVGMKLNIALDEIFSNIIRYSGATEAELECAVGEGQAVLRFTDNGKPYDPTQAPDPDLTLSAEDRDVGGLGIFMVKKFMDSVVYSFQNDRNILTLIKGF